MSHGVNRYTDLRAWQACDTYKKAVYRLCRGTLLATDWRRREQLETSVAGPPAHLSEGFGHFSPLEFARYAGMARASLIESQNHLRDAVDKEYIAEDTRIELDVLAEAALGEVTGLMTYLQSPDALKNAQLARERRLANRQARRSRRSLPELPNSEPPNGELPNGELPNGELPNGELPNGEHPNPERRTRKRT